MLQVLRKILDYSVFSKKVREKGCVFVVKSLRYLSYVSCIRSI